jgi:hypothetical protein
MKMKRLQLALTLSCILFGFPVLAEESLIQPQTQGKITFVTGGVGGDEQEAIQAMRAYYNLHLLFSIKGTGEYVSGVKVRITNSNGNTVMESLSDGPMLFTKLKPGRYTVAVDRDGQVIRKTAKVTGNHKVSLFFTWPQEEED